MNSYLESLNTEGHLRFINDRGYDEFFIGPKSLFSFYFEVLANSILVLYRILQFEVFFTYLISFRGLKTTSSREGK